MQTSYNGGSSYTRRHDNCGDNAAWVTFTFQVPASETQVRVKFRGYYNAGSELGRLDNIRIIGDDAKVSYSTSASITGTANGASASTTVASATRSATDKPILLAMRVGASGTNSQQQVQMYLDGVRFYNQQRAKNSGGADYPAAVLFEAGQEGILYEMQAYDSAMSDANFELVQESLMTKYRISSSASQCPDISTDGASEGYSGATQAASTQCTGSTAGNTCKFECDTDMDPIRGQETRTCAQWGLWTGTPLACATSCPDLVESQASRCERGYVVESFRAGTSWRGGSSDRLVALPWRPSAQLWREEDGYLTLDRDDSCSTHQRHDNYLITMDQGWEDRNMPLDVSVDLYGSEGQAGIVFRTQYDANDPYNEAMGEHYLATVDWDQGELALKRRSSGGILSPFLCTIDLSTTIKADKWHTLRVVADGSDTKIELDGVTWCDTTDSSSKALAFGGAGIFTNAIGAPPRFRDLSIKQIDNECTLGCTDMAEGETCTFACNAPYSPNGDATRTCGSDGAWSG